MRQWKTIGHPNPAHSLFFSGHQRRDRQHRNGRQPNRLSRHPCLAHLSSPLSTVLPSSPPLGTVGNCRRVDHPHSAAPDWRHDGHGIRLGWHVRYRTQGRATSSALAGRWDTCHKRSQLSWIRSHRGSRLATGLVVKTQHMSQGRANCPGCAVPEVPDWPPWHQTWQTSLGTGDSSSPPPHLKVICSCSFYWTVLSYSPPPFFFFGTLDGEHEAAWIIVDKHTNLWDTLFWLDCLLWQCSWWWYEVGCSDTGLDTTVGHPLETYYVKAVFMMMVWSGLFPNTGLDITVGHPLETVIVTCHWFQ